MALIVAFRNISALAETSDYEVSVWINETPIAGPFVVKDHKRADGWQALVTKFVDDKLRLVTVEDLRKKE